jgi:uncharacterized protein (DUF111 family)
VQKLVLHLEEYATRSHILAQLEAAATPEQCNTARACAQEQVFEHEHYHSFGDVCKAIDALSVAPAVKVHMHNVYELLAQAEASVHACSLEETHFHEVGRAQGLRNVLHICLLFQALAPKKVCASRAQAGEGTVECAHGTLCIPAPATAALIARGIPTCSETLPGERMTPTSAAVLLYFVDEWDVPTHS